MLERLTVVQGDRKPTGRRGLEVRISGAYEGYAERVIDKTGRGRTPSNGQRCLFAQQSWVEYELNRLTYTGND